MTASVIHLPTTNDVPETVVAVAKAYIARGWFPLPIPKHKKGPTLSDWPQFQCSSNEVEQHFAECSVGLILGPSGLVDVDFDCAEAQHFVDMLPPFGLSFGRQSKKVSHVLYLASEGAKTRAYKDSAGKVLIELRAGNAATLAPPSSHPSGEQLAWSKSEQPTTASFGDLETAVARIAAFSLLARYWPGPGGRHHSTLALAGMLARAKWSLETALHAVRLLAKATHDSKVGDRITEVKSTYDHYANGHETTGLPTLVELLDPSGSDRES